MASGSVRLWDVLFFSPPFVLRLVFSSAKSGAVDWFSESALNLRPRAPQSAFRALVGTASVSVVFFCTLPLPTLYLCKQAPPLRSFYGPWMTASGALVGVRFGSPVRKCDPFPFSSFIRLCWHLKPSLNQNLPERGLRKVPGFEFLNLLFLLFFSPFTLWAFLRTRRE